MRVDRSLKTYPELVFHVLCHVAETAALPASVYDPAWIRYCAVRLGDAANRTLAEDALALGRLLPGHSELASAQLLAWLFEDVRRASSSLPGELGSLTADQVDAPELLEPLARCGPGVELLRLAAEIERPYFEALPREEVDWSALEVELERVTAAAPELASSGVAVVRPLRLRGRVRGAQIWIGAPHREHGPSTEHVAWQAAHEATVREVGRAAVAAERRVEHMAVVLMNLRAERAQLEREHATWLAHFGPNAPAARLEALPDEQAVVVRRLLLDR
ncbi:MAG: hypothetical protein IPI67_41460 [Myxococcales bacterium]|nr:hypothetical protein [Myxococcales bacterium]